MTLWAGSVLFVVGLLGLAAWGGPVSKREINPSKIIDLKLPAPDASLGSFRILDLGLKSILVGGLISPSQVYILEDGQPLPVTLCGWRQFSDDPRACYAIQGDRVYFSSTDRSPLRTNGKHYEIAWRWKPGPGLIFAGFALLLAATLALEKVHPPSAARMERVRQWIAAQAAETWIIGGFFVTFIYFSFLPIFLNARGEMLQNLVNVPTALAAGRDHFSIVNDMSKAFLFGEPRFVFQGPYPPLTILFHMIFIPLDPVTSYAAISLLTLAAFVLATVAIPGQFAQAGKWSPAILFFLITGLVSYGFQFEVERGQFNVIAIFFVVAAIWLFHRQPRLRWLSYILFTVGVHLKIYPLIFIVNLIDDWRDWKGILKRFALLGGMNLATLFVLGPGSLVQFLKNITGFAEARTTWTRNHSITAFVQLLQGLAPGSSKNWDWLQILLGLIVLAGLALIGWQAYKRNQPGLDPSLLIGCAAVALTIPSISFDYTLAILPIALALGFSNANNLRKGIVPAVLLSLTGLAYGLTLFSVTQKTVAAEMLFIHPPILLLLTNAFPALFALLVAAMGLSFYQTGSIREETQGLLHQLTPE